MQERPFWSSFLASVGAISRRPSAWLAVALAASGSALVAGTWLVAQLSWQARLRTLEAELVSIGAPVRWMCPVC